MTERPPCAVVLAAGAGRRMGHHPKALLALGARSFLEHVVRTARASGCTDVVVVVASAEVARAAAALDCTVVINDAPARGMFSSVQLGLRAGRGHARTALVFPVDHPRVAPTTVATILGTVAARGASAWARPCYRGRGGHPVVLGASAVAAVLAAPADATLRSVLDACSARRVDVDVDDPWVLANVNVPADLARCVDAVSLTNS